MAPHDPKKTVPSKDVLTLRLGAAATPERVAAAARLFAEALRAANPRLGADSITMVVHNRDMVAEFRPWDSQGRTALRTVVQVAENPLRALQKKPETQFVARAFAEHGGELEPYNAEILRKDKPQPVAKIDAAFTKMMRAAASSEQAARALVRGTTQVYSQIYRVGRRDDGKAMEARIRLDDRTYDVQLDDDAAPTFFDAAKDGRVVIVRLQAEWVVDDHGTMFYDPKTTRAVGLDATWEPRAGDVLLEDLRQSTSFDDADLDEIVGRIEET